MFRRWRISRRATVPRLCVSLKVYRDCTEEHALPCIGVIWGRAGGTMISAVRGLVCAAVTLALSTTLLAKGPTTRITISGSALTSPIEISDVNIIKEFQVWAGPGTQTCVGGIANCVEGTEGFIVDWSSGAVSERPSGLE